MSCLLTENNLIDTQGAFEFALFAAKSRLKTCVIQFQETDNEQYDKHMKLILNDSVYPNLNIFPALKRNYHDNNVRSSSVDGSAKEAMELTRLAVVSEKYDLLILDGINKVQERELASLKDIRPSNTYVGLHKLVIIGKTRVAEVASMYDSADEFHWGNC